jgi:hypothetical protein
VSARRLVALLLLFALAGEAAYFRASPPSLAQRLPEQETRVEPDEVDRLFGAGR